MNHFRTLDIKDRAELLREYAKKGYSYSAAVKDFNDGVESYNAGGYMTDTSPEVKRYGEEVIPDIANGVRYGEYTHPSLGTSGYANGYANGGPIRFMQPNDAKLPRVKNPNGSVSSERSASIGGEGGEPAYLVPTLKYGQNLMWPNDPVQEFRNTGEITGGPFKTWQEADKWDREVRHPYVEKGETVPSPLRFKSYAAGGPIKPKATFQKPSDNMLLNKEDQPWPDETLGRAGYVGNFKNGYAKHYFEPIGVERLAFNLTNTERLNRIPSINLDVYYNNDIQKRTMYKLPKTNTVYNEVTGLPLEPDQRPHYVRGIY